jgi:radial spoke head protein 9
MNPSSYQLFRSPQSKEKRAQISRPESIFEFNFMDGITGLKHWSIQTDSSGSEITLRNLLWPGYVGYHRANTNQFGGVYFGDGSKRLDLPFYL